VKTKYISGEAVMNWFETLFADWVVRRRWWVIVASIAAVLIIGSGVRFLSFSNDTRVFFSADNPQLQALEALESTYLKSEGVMFVIAPRDKQVFTRETLSAVAELTEAAWQIPFSTRIDSVTNFQHTHSERDDLIVESLVENAAELSDSELTRIEKIAQSEPLLLNRLVSASGHVTGVNVTTLLPGKSMTEIPEVATFVQKMAAEIRAQHPNLDIYLTGTVMSDFSFGEAGMRDMSTLIPLMFLTLVVVAGMALRSIAATIATVVIILVSMVSGMGLAGWFGITMTAASANAPTIILTLAVADSVHVLSTLFGQLRSGKSRHQAAAESVRINFKPVALTSITTAVGFLTMNFSDAPPFRDLGNIVAMGVIAAFVFSVTFLPALMAVLPLRAKQGKQTDKQHALERLADIVSSKRTPLFWSLLGAIVVISTGVARIDLNDDWMKYFDKSFAIRIATDFTEDNLTGIHQIEYSLASGMTAGVSNPEYLETVDAFAAWYRLQPKVSHVNSFTDTMKRLNMNMHGDDEKYYRLPQQQELAAQYLLLYEMSLPYGLGLDNQIDMEKSATRMVVTLKGVTTRELRAMDKVARGWLSANAPTSMYTHGSGLSIIWAHISERNIKSMLGASIGALLLISVILMFALRSFKLGCVSLLPNLAPVIVAMGAWGFFVGQIGLGLSVIAAMTLGIVVDDTVHLLTKYQRARQELSMSPTEAVRYSFRTVGTALITTTVALIAGFLVLSLSSYNMNADMAVMTAMTIAFALILDLLLLPPLLYRLEDREAKYTPQSNTISYSAAEINESEYLINSWRL
jgi:predicted RND superfamily exporter protein